MSREAEVTARKHKSTTRVVLIGLSVICLLFSGVRIESVRVSQRAREAILQTDLCIVRNATEHYTLDKGRRPKSLQDPRSWIERTHGSQALIGHVDSIWGLEAESDGTYTFATVPRSHGLITLELEKEADAEVFKLSDDPLGCFTDEQRKHWQALPESFTWTQALQLNVPKASLSRLVKAALNNGVLAKDGDTYRKSVPI